MELYVRSMAVADPLYLAWALLGRELMANPSPEHREVAKALVAQENLLFIYPRGHLKTTLVDEIGTIWQLLKYPNDRILILQASLENAKGIAKQIRRHFQQTERFNKLFPEYHITSSDEAGNILKFSVPCRTVNTREESIEIGTPEGALAGRHYDVIRASDLMNEQTTPAPCGSSTPEMMRKIIDWYGSTDALLDGRHISPRAHKTIDGTYYADGDLYNELVRNDDKNHFRKIIKGVTGKSGAWVPVWEAFNAIELQRKYDSPTMHDALWAANYMSDPLPPEGTSTFRREWFVEYDKAPDDLIVAITVDPAYTEQDKNPKADRSAIIVSGASPERGELYILVAEAGRWSPRDLLERIHLLSEIWKPDWVGIEMGAQAKSLEEMFFEDMQRTGRYVNYRALQTKGKNKTVRVMPLLGFAQKWGIKVKPEHQELVDECMRFPVGRHDDYVDALAYRAQDLYFNRNIRAVRDETILRSVPPSGKETGKDFFNRMKERMQRADRPRWLRAV